MSNVNKVSIIKQLESSSPLKIVDLPEVADRFKKLYLTFHGKSGEKYYEAEKFHFAKIIKENPKLQECTKLSLYGVFLDMAVNGLSFDPSMKHAYIVPYNTKVKQGGVERWEQRAQLQISGQGELVLRMNHGQIKYADNPVLVYEGDVFKYGTRNGLIYVEHEAVFPRKSDKIMACYLRIERNDNSVDYKVLSIEEIEKLRKFSKDPNSKAWTDGLPGMVQTKTIKHAFKSYPKLRPLERSKFTALASETIDEDAEVIEGDIYGLEDAHEEPTRESNETIVIDSKTEAEEVDDEAFVKSEKPSASNVRVFQDDDF